MISKGIHQFVEIGPGKGALTLPIAKISKKITCIEIDPLLFKYLEDKEIPNLEIINEDFLDFKLDSKLCITHYFVFFKNLFGSPPTIYN